MNAINPAELKMRRAQAQDCLLVHQWRSDPKTFQFMFNARPIPLEEHQEWFKKIISHPQWFLLIGLYEGRECGVVQLDARENKDVAEISIYLAPEFRGRSLGGPLLKASEQWAQAHTPIRKIVAKVLEENIPSLQMFKNGGYQSQYVLFEKVISN